MVESSPSWQRFIMNQQYLFGCQPVVSGTINQAYLCNVSFNQHCLACSVPFDIICMQQSALCSRRFGYNRTQTHTCTHAPAADTNIKMCSSQAQSVFAHILYTFTHLHAPTCAYKHSHRTYIKHKHIMHII